MHPALIPINPALILLLLIAAAWAIVTDCMASRISNRLTFGGAALALALHLLTGGPESVLAGAEGWLLGVALLIVPFALHWMGAGDVKLLALFGAIGGPSFVVTALLLGSAMGGALALLYLAREHKVGLLLSYLPLGVQPTPGTLVDAKRRMPFGPALAAGAVAALFVSGPLW